MPEIPVIALRQSGVFSRAQAYDAGWTPRQVRRRLDAGRWRSFAGAALCASDTTVGADELGWAVTLTWPGAVISHELAGALRGFPLSPPSYATATVDRERGLTAQGLVAHRIHLAPAEVGSVRGLATTTSRRTAVDLLASLPWPQARQLWAWTVARNLLRPDQLAEAAAARVGWRGTPQLKRLVRSTSSGALSEAENRLHALLRKGRLEGWVANAPIRVGGRIVAVADVLFRDARLVLEVDGYASHAGVTAFHQDRARQNALVLAGYTVLRFTWRDLTCRPDEVLRQIQRAVRPRTAQ